jgi:hypothetical protein
MNYSDASAPDVPHGRGAARHDGNIIPNREGPFAQPREVMKYQALANCAPAGLALGLREGRQDALQAAEDLAQAREAAREDGGKEAPRRLFRESRQVMKCGDVDGSHPASVFPRSPTFASTIFT